MPGWEMTVTTDTEALVRRAYHLAEGDVLDVQGFIDLFAEDGVFNGIGGVSGQRATGVSNWAMWSSGWATCFPTFTGGCTGSTCSGTSSRSRCRSGAPPRAVRDARRRDPADGGQARHPDRRLLVCARRQDPGVQLPYRYDHHVRAAGRTAGLRVRSRGVRARTIRPTDKGARLLGSRALQAGLRRGRMACWLRVTRWTSTGSRPSISTCASTPNPRHDR